MLEHLQIFAWRYNTKLYLLCLVLYPAQKMRFPLRISSVNVTRSTDFQEYFHDFRQKTTSETRRCCNVNTRSKSPRRKHNVVTTLVFGRNNDVGNATFWQRCDNIIRRRDQNTNKT